MGRRERRRSDLDRREEMLSHIRIEADRIEAQGLSRGEAMARARSTFGHAGLARSRSETRYG